MAPGSNPKPSILISLLLFSSFLSLPFTTLADQFNLQTYFPSLPTPITDIPLPPPPPPPPPCKEKKDNSRVTNAVLATAASSFAFATFLFFAFYCLVLRRQRPKPADAKKSSGLTRLRSSKKSWGRRRGSIVDEDGLDAIYLREFNRMRSNGKEIEREEDDGRRSIKFRSPMRIQETPLAHAGPIDSSSEIFEETPFDDSTDSLPELRPPPGRITSQSRKKPTPTPPAPPPPVVKTYAAPRPPPPPPMTKSSASPLPPPPPPGPKPPKTPPAGRPPAGALSAARPPLAAAEGGQKKLKPLHWDKLNKMNVQHSMVWDEITEGSFRYDEDILEALFGSLATNKNSGKDSSDASASSSTTAAGSVAPAQVCLLDPRRSQNMAIVLRSLAASRQDIMDALVDGHGLSHDTLERLTSIAPTKEEEELIRSYSGDLAVLAEAELFLFHLFRAAAAPFARLDAMLFRSNYKQEISHVKQSLQTLEQACRELKTRGLFLKLLEAVLKAGNRMNAGTARGNAKAFNLSALNKLSDVKSTDGSTTLLNFIVQEVVRAEGKRLALNRGYSLRRSDTGGQGSLDRMVSRGNRPEREKEYSKLGLPIVGGLSDEFASLKKAAGIDYDALLSTCAALGARVAVIRRLLSGDDGFTRETKSFVDRAEEELRTAKEEQERVAELVRKTVDYYQPGASKEKGARPLNLFIIVRDFLSMVDKACVDIARNLQKKTSPNSSSVGSPSTGSGSPSSQQPGSASPEGSEKGRRPVVRFPNLPPRFMSENKSDSSSDEE